MAEAASGELELSEVRRVTGPWLIVRLVCLARGICFVDGCWGLWVLTR